MQDKEKDKKQVQSGHRDRLREQILKNGILSIPPYQILEFLLFYGIPYKDTKPIAHNLLQKYDSLNNVLCAPVEELMKEQDMTRNAAMLLHIMPDLFALYAEQKIKQTKVLGYGDIISFLRKVVPVDVEAVYLICLDEINNVLATVLLQTGHCNQVQINTQDIVEGALRNRAKKVLLAHNHPSEIVNPSQEDLLATKRLQRLLASLSVELIDHVIIGDNRIFSMHAGTVIEQ